MKAEDMKIFRLEDRILFEAAAAAEIVAAADAVQNDPNANETERLAQEELYALKNVPVPTDSILEKSAAEAPAEIADADAQINTLIDGILPAPGTAGESLAEEDSTTVTLADNGLTLSTERELIVVNDYIKNLDEILSQVKPHQDVLVLEAGNGLQELNDWLDSNDTVYSAIHFITHGTDGKIAVNGAMIDNDTFEMPQWQAIGEHLTAEGDILLYGCDTAESEAGKLLIDRIADASGADVAASTDTTGFSGDWDLEYNVGVIDAAAFSVEGYTGSLAEIQVNSATELETALDTVSTNGGDYTITLMKDITVDSELTYFFDKDLTLTIRGNTDGISLETNDGFGIFYFIDPDGTFDFTISNLDFAAKGTERAIYFDGIDSLTIENSSFANFKYGAVYYDAAGGSLTVSQTEFLNNTYTGDGGAIHAIGAEVAISNSYFAENSADGTGGALEIEAAPTITISNTTFYKNSAQEGGAINVIEHSGTLSVSNSTFYQNEAEGLGGAISIQYNGTSGSSSVTNSTFTANTVTGTGASGAAIYNAEGALTIQNTLLVGNGTEDLYQEQNGSVTLSHTLVTVAAGTGTITQGSGAKIDAAYTADAVFGTNTYNTTTHTIAPDAFHEAAWGGVKLSEYDQLGGSRDSINTTTGLTGKYSIGAVSAAAGLMVTQGNYSTPYTGTNITPEEHLTLSYADGTVLSMPVSATLSPGTVKDIGTYTITPSNAVVSGLPTGANVQYAYTAGTLTVYNWGDLVIQQNDFTYTYSDTMPLQSQYTFETDDLRTADPTDKVTITINVQWQIIDGKVTYSSSGNVNASTSPYADSLSVKSFTAVDENGNDMIPYYTWNTTTTSDLTVNAKTLNVTIDGTMFNKVYDGTTATEEADNNYATDAVAGDTVIVSGTYAYDNKNVDNDKTVTFSGLTLSGADAGNYLLAATEVSDNGAVITARTLNVTIDGTMFNKVYDGTTATEDADNNYATDAVAGDVVIVSGTYAYDNKNVDNDKTVTFSGLTLSGADAGNYILAATEVSDEGAAITARTLNVTIDGTLFNKVYDGTTATEEADNNYATDAVAGDTVIVSGTYAYDNKNVDNDKTVTFSGLTLSGADAGNYILAATEVSDDGAAITAKTLNVTIDGTMFNKVYDGTTATEEADNNYATDAVAGDTVIVSGTYAYDNKNVDNDKTVTFSGLTLSGADAGNYILAATEVSDDGAAITARTLNVTIDGTMFNKVYDGTTATEEADNNYATDAVAGDVVIVSGTYAYDNKNVDNDKTVTFSGLTLSGADAGNYILAATEVSDEGAAITARTLNVTIDGTMFNKVYDGTTATEEADNNYATDAVAGDTVIVSGTYAYDNKNVDNDKTVTFSGLTLSGADAGNYILAATEVSDDGAAITPRQLDITVILPDNKIYDGTDDVNAQVTINNVVQGDDLDVLTEWQYNSPDVTTADTIHNVIWQLTGDDAENYALPSVTPYDNITAAITPKDVQVTFDTDAPYFYTGQDQSDTVSASYVDINGNTVTVTLNWNGEEFIGVGTYTVTAEGSDPNYNLTGATTVLVMNPALILPSETIYTEGLNEIFASTIPALEGQILANNTNVGDIYTLTWAELISEALDPERGIIMDESNYPGLNYGTDFSTLRITIDTLKYRPFDIDKPMRELSWTITYNNQLHTPQGLFLGKELFIDGNHPESDFMQLFEKRGDTFSEHHDPIYVERDYTAEEAENLAFHLAPQQLQMPVRNLADANTIQYDVPALATLPEKVSNLKSDLEKLLDEMTLLS